MMQAHVVEEDAPEEFEETTTWATMDNTECYNSGFDDTMPTLEWEESTGRFKVRGKIFLQKFGGHALYRLGYEGSFVDIEDNNTVTSQCWDQTWLCASSK